MAERYSVSLESLLRELYNTFITDQLLSKLSLNAEFGIRDPMVTSVIQIGRITY